MPLNRPIVAGSLALVCSLALAGEATAGNGKAAMSVLPKDASGIMTINVDRFRKSPHYAKAMEVLRDKGDFGKELDALREGAGLDLEKDIGTIVIGLPQDLQKGESEFVFVMEGKFNPRAVLKALTAKFAGKITPAKHRNVTYWANESSAIAIVGKRVVVAKTIDRLKAAINASKSKASSLLANDAVVGLVKDADTSKDMWLAMRLDSVAGMGSMMPDVHGLTGSADLATKGAALAFAMLAVTGEAARSLKTQLDAAVSMGASNQEFGPLLKKVSIKQDGNRVALKLSLSEAEVKTLSGVMATMGGAF
jgi:hypothetical protein